MDDIVNMLNFGCALLERVGVQYCKNSGNLIYFLTPLML